MESQPSFFSKVKNGFKRVIGKKGTSAEKERLTNERKRMESTDNVYTASSEKRNTDTWTDIDPATFSVGSYHNDNLPNFPLVDDDIPWESFEDKTF